MTSLCAGIVRYLSSYQTILNKESYIFNYLSGTDKNLASVLNRNFYLVSILYQTTARLAD